MVITQAIASEVAIALALCGTGHKSLGIEVTSGTVTSVHLDCGSYRKS